MAEDTHTFAFDFVEEVQRLQRALGSLADSIVFMNVNVNGPHIALHHVIRGKGVTDRNVEYAKDDIERVYGKSPNHSSFTLFNLCRDPDDTSRQAVVFKNGDYNRERFGAGYDELFPLFILYHETAHAVMVGNKADDPANECAADAFAALLLLQRFGPDAIPFLSMLSWDRALVARRVGASHFTTMTLDKIIADSKTRNFSQLTAEETVALAREYALLAPTPAAATAAEKALENEKPAQTWNELLFPCLSLSSPEVTFLASAKIAQPLLKREGILYDGKVFKLTYGKRLRYASAIKLRLATMRIKNTFNKAAAKSAKRPVITPVFLPRGQKQFVFNWGS